MKELVNIISILIVVSFRTFYPICTFFGRKKTYLFKQQVKVQKIKTTDFIQIKADKQLWREKPPFASISSLIRRVRSIFRQKVDELIPSEMDIRVVNPAPIFCL